MGSQVEETTKNGEKMDEEIELIISSLPKEKGWFFENIYKYEGFWCEKIFLNGSLIVKRSFDPKPENVILATLPKAGTTWFSALLYTTINRTRYDYSTRHPLLTKSVRDCVRHVEFEPFKNDTNNKKTTFFSNLTTSLISTHMPYSFFPKSITQHCDCKIVYVCRNPMDEFVSLFHNVNKFRSEKEFPPLGFNEAFEMFCNGVSPAGSYWDHVLEYWYASIEMPNKVCFVRYEDMKKQPILVLKKLAEFIGCPFSTEEEQDGVVQKIVDFCNFESLTSFQANRDPIHKNSDGNWLQDAVDNVFFRKGQIGDHKNYLTDEMIKRLKDIISTKFAGTGLEVDRV